MLLNHIASNFHFSQFGLLLIAFLLGMRHGLDLDHLAMIDSITRRLPIQSRLSRFVGLLFSLGHGIVVIVFCIFINYFVKNYTLPIWLGRLMVGLSIVFLIVFGALNIYSLSKRKKTSRRDLIFSAKKGLKKFRLLTIESPFLIMMIGAVFAVSFDTISQITLFSINMLRFSQNIFPVLLGLVFMMGMIITDAANGLMVAFLIQKASKLSHTLSRIFTVSIGLFSTTMGIYEIVHLI